MKKSDYVSLKPKRIGQIIRQARERQGLSQEKLAGAMNLGQRAISELENGSRRLTIQEVQKLSELLDIPILDFFEAHELHRDDLDLSLLRVFHALPNDKMRRAVIHVIQSLVDTTEK